MFFSSDVDFFFFLSVIPSWEKLLGVSSIFWCIVLSALPLPNHHSNKTEEPWSLIPSLPPTNLLHQCFTNAHTQVYAYGYQYHFTKFLELDTNCCKMEHFIKMVANCLDWQLLLLLFTHFILFCHLSLDSFTPSITSFNEISNNKTCSWGTNFSWVKTWWFFSMDPDTQLCAPGLRENEKFFLCSCPKFSKSVKPLLGS